VGKVTEVNTETITSIISEEKVPVISPLATEQGSSDFLNINADLAAAAMAKKLEVSKLIYLSDVPGVMH